MSMTDEQAKEISNAVREESVDLHRWLRHGHLEKVYENGLLHRLRKRGLTVEQQWPLQVRDRDETILGDYLADLFLEQEIVVELKAVRAITDDHIVQLPGYLRASAKRHGLLINFGAPKLQIRKFVL